MIATEIEEVSSCNIDDVFDVCLAAISRLRSRNGSFEQGSIAQSRHAAMHRQYFVVNRFHRLDGEKPEILLRQGV
jgi:hypothetical protein